MIPKQVTRHGCVSSTCPHCAVWHRRYAGARSSWLGFLWMAILAPAILPLVYEQAQVCYPLGFAERRERARAHTHTHTHTFRIHIYTRTRAHTCTQTHTRARTHTNTYTPQVRKHGSVDVAMHVNYKVPTDSAAALAVATKAICIPLQIAVYYHLANTVMPTVSSAAATKKAN